MFPFKQISFKRIFFSSKTKQFKAVNLLLPEKTVEHIPNELLEDYATKLKQVRREYWLKYGLGRNKKVETGVERARRREVAEAEWQRHVERVTRDLNPEDYLTEEQKRALEQRKEEEAKEEHLRRERGKVRLKLASQKTEAAKQRQVQLLREMPLIRSEEQLWDAIDLALKTPLQLPESIEECREKFEERMAKAQGDAPNEVQFDKTLFPNGLKDILPDKYKNKIEVIIE